MADEDPWIEQFTVACRAQIDAAVTRQWQGAANMVFATEAGQVWRFPLRPIDVERIEEIAARHRAAHERQMCAPEVISVASGPVGEAHLVLEHLPGTPLLQAVASGHATHSAVRTALTLLRSTQDWPFPQVSWADLWSGLATRAEESRHRLPDAEDHIAAARTAATTAAEAPLGILHGDLGSDNLLIDADGQLTGLLDWDGAVVGDPALDTAAVLYSLPAETSQYLRAENGWIAADLARADDYLATWELQDLLGRMSTDQATPRGRN